MTPPPPMLPADPPPADPSRRVDLVLEGGGVKGIAIAGALEVLAERGYTVNRVAGSSAGAMAGALAAAGVPATTLVEILRGTDYRAFQDGGWWTRTLPGMTLAIALRNGVHPGKRLESWTREQLEAHAPSPVRTFADLTYADPDGEEIAGPATRLTVTASDLSAGRLRFLPEDAAAYGQEPGAMDVAQAVRASASIPFVFRPARFTDALGRAAWLVDGGLLSNFPVEVFDRPGGRAPRWPTFAVKLSERPTEAAGPVHRIRGPLSFARAVAGTVTGFYDRMHIESSHAVARTIFIDTSAVKPTEFDLSDEQREALYAEGREAAIQFLDGDATHEAWDFARYVERFRS